MQFLGKTDVKSLYIPPLHSHLPMYYTIFSRDLSCPASLDLLVHPLDQTTLPTLAMQKVIAAMSLPPLALVYSQIATGPDTL